MAEAEVRMLVVEVHMAEDATRIIVAQPHPQQQGLLHHTHLWQAETTREMCHLLPLNATMPQGVSLLQTEITEVVKSAHHLRHRRALDNLHPATHRLLPNIEMTRHDRLNHKDMVLREAAIQAFINLELSPLAQKMIIHRVKR